MYVYVWVYISLTGNFSLHLHIAKLLTNVCMCMYECTFLSLASISIHASDRDDKLAVNLLDTSRSSMNCRQRQQPESISSPISDLSLSGSSRFLLRVFFCSAFCYFIARFYPFLSTTNQSVNVCVIIPAICCCANCRLHSTASRFLSPRLTYIAARADDK